MTQNSYVYGVMRAADLPEASALDFRPVFDPTAAISLVNAGPLRVVVSEIEDDEILSTRRNMLAHAKALETLMGFGPVLPMRFGMIAPTEAQIAQAIDLKQDALLEHLASVEGCAEYGVTIAWERAEAMREVVAATPALKTAYERLAGRSAAETHFDRLELGRRVEGALFSKRIEEAAKLTERLAPLAREIAEREPEEDIQVLKADLLIKQDRAAALSALLEEIEAEAPGRLRIKLVGPSPAYAFSKLTLGWGDAAPSRAGGQGGPAAWVS